MSCNGSTAVACGLKPSQLAGLASVRQAWCLRKQGTCTRQVFHHIALEVLWASGAQCAVAKLQGTFWLLSQAAAPAPCICPPVLPCAAHLPARETALTAASTANSRPGGIANHHSTTCWHNWHMRKACAPALGRVAPTSPAAASSDGMTRDGRSPTLPSLLPECRAALGPVRCHSLQRTIGLAPGATQWQAPIWPSDQRRQSNRRLGCQGCRSSVHRLGPVRSGM